MHVMAAAWAVAAAMAAILLPCCAAAGSAPLDDTNFAKATKAWGEGPTEAETLYGHISRWNTSLVTRMGVDVRGGSDEMDPDLPSKFNYDIDSWQTERVIHMRGLFAGQISFNQPLDSWDVDKVTTLEEAFRSHVALSMPFNQPLDSWQTGFVKSLRNTFAGSVFNQPLGSWDTSAVEDMEGVFLSGAHPGTQYFNQDINAWDTSRVLKLNRAFYHCPHFNQPLDSWDTGKVTGMSNMFFRASEFDQPLASWNTAAVEYMNGMFYEASKFNSNISAWTITFENTIPARGMFDGSALAKANGNCQDDCPHAPFSPFFTGPSQGPTSLQIITAVASTTTTTTTPSTPAMPTSHKVLFDATKSDLNLELKRGVLKYVDCIVGVQNKPASAVTAACGDLNTWDTSRVTKLDELFKEIVGGKEIVMTVGKLCFNAAVSDWQTANVTTMEATFRGAVKFNQDVNTWNTARVKNMAHLFQRCSVFSPPTLDSWQTSAVTDMAGMFSDAVNFNAELSSWDTSAVQNMQQMFAVTEHGVSQIRRDLGPEVWDPAEEHRNSAGFRRVNLSDIVTNGFNVDINSWDVSSVKDMTSTFQSCVSFNQPLRSWKTSAVTTMKAMFSGSVEGRKSHVLNMKFNRPLNSWRTAKITSMLHMFYYSHSFNQALSAWQTSAVTNFQRMFTWATAFNQNLSSWDLDATNCDDSSFFNYHCDDSSFFNYRDSDGQEHCIRDAMSDCNKAAIAHSVNWNRPGSARCYPSSWKCLPSCSGGTFPTAAKCPTATTARKQGGGRDATAPTTRAIGTSTSASASLGMYPRTGDAINASVAVRGRRPPQQEPNATYPNSSSVHRHPGKAFPGSSSTQLGKGKTTSTAPPQVADDGGSGDKSGVVAAVAIVVVILVAVCVGVAAWWCHLRRSAEQNKRDRNAADGLVLNVTAAVGTAPAPQSFSNNEAYDDTEHALAAHANAISTGARVIAPAISDDGYEMPDRVPGAGTGGGSVASLTDIYALDPRRVTTHKTSELGKGNYGVVYRGTLSGDSRTGGNHGLGTTEERDVAVKMLPQDRSVAEHERQDFWEEVKFLRSLQRKGGHGNIIEFVGYVLGDDMQLLLEFAPGGSLVGYLRKQDMSRPLPELVAVQFAAQIAAGMQHIEANKLLHRDLAARNVLLSASLECKISDFGLARDVYAGGEYRANFGTGKQSNPTAYKWTAIEGLVYNAFTIKGDVWSFGILLSEICSLGTVPYPQFRTLSVDFIEFLKGGQRMQRGALWSLHLFEVMRRCWNVAPGARPSFAQLAAELEEERARLASLPRAADVGAAGSQHRARPATPPISDDGYQMPWQQAESDSGYQMPSNPAKQKSTGAPGPGNETSARPEATREASRQAGHVLVSATPLPADDAGASNEAGYVLASATPLPADDAGASNAAGYVLASATPLPADDAEPSNVAGYVLASATPPSIVVTGHNEAGHNEAGYVLASATPPSVVVTGARTGAEQEYQLASAQVVRSKDSAAGAVGTAAQAQAQDLFKVQADPVPTSHGKGTPWWANAKGRGKKGGGTTKDKARKLKGKRHDNRMISLKAQDTGGMMMINPMRAGNGPAQNLKETSA